MRRLMLVTTLVIGLMAVTAGPALAHFCENASRSDTANTKVAEKSKAWVRVGDALEDWFHEMDAWFGVGNATDEQIEEMVERAEDQLSPELLDIVILERATAAGGLLRKLNPENPFDEAYWPKQMTDRKGIDLRVDLVLAFDDLESIYFDVMNANGG